MKTTSKWIILLSGIMFSFSAFGVDLETARKNKTIVELPSGYVESKEASTKDLAKEVNDKRKQAYEAIAKQNKLPIEKVAEQAAKKIEEKMKSGK